MKIRFALVAQEVYGTNIVTGVVCVPARVPLDGLKVVPPGPPDADQFRIGEEPGPIERFSIHVQPLLLISNVQSEFASKLD